MTDTPQVTPVRGIHDMDEMNFSESLPDLRLGIRRQVYNRLSTTDHDGMELRRQSRYSGHMVNDTRAAADKLTAAFVSASAHQPHQPLREHWQRSNRYSGWRMGVLVGCLTSFTVLCVNVGLLLWGATRRGGFTDGVATLYGGSAVIVGR